MKTFLRSVLAAVAAYATLTGHHAFAQVGNDNPAGVAGEFNGNINTGCSYDPYTGNARRVVTDIKIDGTLGTIPLNLTRYSNSRNPGGSGAFGTAGGWRHSYDWSMDPTSVNTPASTYTVRFPDGRVETFSPSASDTYLRAGLGTKERFAPFGSNPSSPNSGTLILEDGSKIRFLRSGTAPNYTFGAVDIHDPFGVTTLLSYNGPRIIDVYQPDGGRSLHFVYKIVGGKIVIDRVVDSEGRYVQYYYIVSAFSPGTTSYVCLDHVVYYLDAQWTAQYKYKAPNIGSANGTPLLWKCDDPLYAGPMKKIAYTYATSNNADGSAPVYGQILSENYYDGTNVGAAVTTLSVNGSTRTETRGDGTHPTRTFSYTSYKLTSFTDFLGATTSKVYDSNFYVTSITDRNGHTTDFTVHPLTGAILSITYPATPGDAPAGRGVVSRTFGGAGCLDLHNQDPNMPYYVCSTTDEAGNTTTYTRNTEHRVEHIAYPDGGFENFTYNYLNGNVLTHQLRAGGTEAWTYNSDSGDMLTYRDPYHDPINKTGTPSLRYTTDSSGKIISITDVLGNVTSYAYDSRKQLTTTTFPVDAVDGQRHTITNVYNPDGTLQNTTDQLGHQTSYTYDDYKRLVTTTTPLRFTGDTTPRTTYRFYDANGTGNDYTHADSNVTHLKVPGGEITTTIYDQNFRKTSVTVADGTADSAKTTYAYDNVGNVTSIISPKEQPGQAFAGQSVTVQYDERNRTYAITDALTQTMSITYDAGGRRSSINRPNGQLATFDSYDAMNRLLQKTVAQTPEPDAVTKYTYYSSGLLHTMQDPRSVENASGAVYEYIYDDMGRKTQAIYPAPDSMSSPTSEVWHYDTAGRVDTFTNRNSKTQSKTYDALNRMTGFTWNDGLTPGVTFGYDVANRLLSVVNANATITRAYFDDNLLKSETSTYADNTARTVTYAYNANADRSTIQYPASAYSFNYTYTGRRQLKNLVNTAGGAPIMGYAYDPNGNVITRSPDNSTSSSYTYDGLDRVTNISHALNGTTRTLDYGYDSVGNQKWVKRDGGNGDAFGYDLNDQAIGVWLDVSSPEWFVSGQTLGYDANGNRTNGGTNFYETNDLNQYVSRNFDAADYDHNGNTTTGLDGSNCTFDAQNRLLTAAKGSTTETYKYDGLNRQVSRQIGVATPLYNVYDGWTLIGEYQPSATTPTTAYLNDATGMVKLMTSSSSFYYYGDASGSTSHLADSTGHLAESYRYDLHGTPIFYGSTGSQIPASIYGIRHLFTGQQWYSGIGLYDLRNRFYSPDAGRFLQADPIGFNGDPTNLYRHCGNNPRRWSDPSGLADLMPGGDKMMDLTTATPVVVTAVDMRDFEGGASDSGGSGGFGGLGGPTDGVSAGGGPPEPPAPGETPEPSPSRTPSPAPTNAPKTPTPPLTPDLTPIPYSDAPVPVITPIIMPEGFNAHYFYHATPTPTPTPLPNLWEGFDTNF